MHDIVARFDFCSYLLVLICALVLARQAGRFLPRFAKAMWWAGTGVLVGVTGYSYAELQPRRPDDVIAILGVAGIAGCAAALIAAIVLTPVAAIGDWLHRLILDRRADMRQREQERRTAINERRQEEHRRQEQMARQHTEEKYRRSLPPPPTRDELANAAKQRYQQTIRMLDAANLDSAESDAARDRAKQKYLNELDGLMK